MKSFANNGNKMDRCDRSVGWAALESKSTTSPCQPAVFELSFLNFLSPGPLLGDFSADSTLEEMLRCCGTHFRIGCGRYLFSRTKVTSQQSLFISHHLTVPSKNRLLHCNDGLARGFSNLGRRIGISQHCSRSPSTAAPRPRTQYISLLRDHSKALSDCLLQALLWVGPDLVAIIPVRRHTQRGGFNPVNAPHILCMRLA